MKVLRIAARQAGRRRAGIEHPAHAVDHPLDRFTAAQVKALKADRQLVVSEVEIEEPAEKGGAKAAGAKSGAASKAGS